MARYTVNVSTSAMDLIPSSVTWMPSDPEILYSTWNVNSKEDRMDEWFSGPLQVHQITLRNSTPKANLMSSVVTGLKGRTVEVLEQNVGGVRKVQKGQVIIEELVSGRLWIYRPVWDSWAGSLEPKWENGW